MYATLKFKDKIKIVGVSGSLRPGSFTHKTVEMALQGAAELGVETQFVDLRNYEMVFYGMMEEDDYPEDIIRLRKEVKDAHGLILGTPEYHSSLSGVLKNFLDLMGFNEFEGKMVGLVGVAGGTLGATNALNSLRTIGRSLHAWVLPQQVSIPQVWKCFDEDGKMTDKDIEARLLELGRQVARFADFREMQKDQDFIRMWEALPLNPGGDKP